MNWDSFIEKLAIGKKDKKTTGLDMGCITHLIYSGAFDSIYPESIIQENQLDIYRNMRETARKALKSQAKLSKAKASDIIGLNEVDSPASLALWRYQQNPITEFDLLTHFSASLKMRGFSSGYDGVFPWRKDAVPQQSTTCVISDRWSQVFRSPENKFFDDLKQGRIRLFILGLVTNVEIRPYDNDKKKMLKFRLFTGKEHTDSIIVWPEKNGKLKEMYKSLIKPKTLTFVEVRPNMYLGRKGGRMVQWESLIR